MQMTEQEIISGLQRASRLVKGKPLTTTQYTALAPKHGLPAFYTVCRPFDNNWAAACEAAGIKHNPSRGSYSTSYTAEDCLLAIKQCASDLGASPSYREYCEWWASSHKDLPSGQTVRLRLDGWTEAVERALSID